MTTGSRTLDSTYVDANGLRVGKKSYLEWNGGDATPSERAAAKRLSRPKGASTRPRSKLSLPPHAYSKGRVDEQLGGYVFVAGSGNGTAYFSTGALPPTIPPVPPEAYYALISRVRNRVYGSGFHPGIFAAEMPKAVRMIGDAAKHIRLGMLHAAYGDFRGAFRTLGGHPPASVGRNIQRDTIRYMEGHLSFSRLWLQYRYGWRPLVKDIEDGSIYIYENLTRPVNDKRRVSARYPFEVKQEWDPPYGGVSVTRSVTTYELRCIITNLRADSPFLPSLASVASVAWEVLPYSFVYDWVIPVGSYLEALRVASAIKGTVVTSVKASTTYDRVRASAVGGIKPGTFRQYTLWPTELRRFSFSRTVSDELYPPIPTGNLSISDVLPDWKRAATSVALLSTGLRGIIPEWMKDRPSQRPRIARALGR